jgi:plastocyanin
MFPAMRFVLVLVLCLAALAAAPALAADSTVDVQDDQFVPSSTSVNPGDIVTWNWSGFNDHTVTSRSRQIDRFNSRLRQRGATFARTFRYRGRFRYFCEIHFGMTGAVTVGTDDGVAPRITRISAGSRRVRFTISERSVVTVKVTGRRRIIKVFGAGRHSVRYKRLGLGLKRAALSAKDGFGHIGRKSKRFRIR